MSKHLKPHWKFTEVDNGKHKYKVKRECGHIVDIEVPEEHRKEIATGAYIQAVCDAHDSVLESVVIHDLKEGEVVLTEKITIHSAWYILWGSLLTEFFHFVLRHLG